MKKKKGGRAPSVSGILRCLYWPLPATCETLNEAVRFSVLTESGTLFLVAAGRKGTGEVDDEVVGSLHAPTRLRGFGMETYTKKSFRYQLPG
jgi:hypothetical protein